MRYVKRRRGGRQSRQDFKGRRFKSIFETAIRISDARKPIFVVEPVYAGVIVLVAVVFVVVTVACIAVVAFIFAAVNPRRVMVAVTTFFVALRLDVPASPARSTQRPCCDQREKI